MSEVRNRSGSSLNLDTTVVGLQGFPISPTGPTSGQALVFNGTDWTPTDVQTTAPPPAAVGPTPPASPGSGDLWFNTTTGILNVWNGSAWVPTYVDNDPFLPLAGGTLTGPLVLSGDAAAPLNPVSLQQLNAAISGLPPPPPPTSVGSTPPASPGTGDQWFNTDNGTLNVWNGTAWVPVEAVTSIGSTPPTNPAPGQLWWDDVSGQLFVWYVDANSSQWVVANVAQGVPGPPGPPGPSVMPMGVTDGSNAAPGQVGEYLSFNSGQITNVASGTDIGPLSLSPGDWDVIVTTSAYATAMTNVFGSIYVNGTAIIGTTFPFIGLNNSTVLANIIGVLQPIRVNSSTPSSVTARVAYTGAGSNSTYTTVNIVARRMR